MQRLVYLCTRTSRLFQVVDANNHFKHSKLLYENQFLKFNRHLATKNTKDIDTHSDLYKPSTDKEKTDVPDELTGGQSPETFQINPSDLKPAAKVWSAQNPDGVHVAPLAGVEATTFVPTSNVGGKAAHERTVYTTQGELNITDPFKIRKLQGEPTPVQYAEAAAESAFEPFAPDAPLKSSSKTAKPVFTPKISSNDTYSTTMSPTSEFDTTVRTSSSSQDTVKYETSLKGKIHGGQDTTAETKKHPKENPFNLKEEIKPSRDIRGDILRESLKYVHEKGWSMEAIRAGISACNESTTAEKLFCNSYELVDYFMSDANAKMVNYMNELADKENIQGTRLLIDGLKYRLKLVIPYANTWEQALAQKGLPQNAKRAWKNLLDFANDAFINIGDTSTDIKWYTKRLSVATIYRSAEIYMLQDQSPDKIETMNFLERHLGDFQTTGSVRRSVSQSLSDTAQVASGLLTVVRTMTIRR